MKLYLIIALLLTTPQEWDGVKTTHSEKEWRELLGEVRFNIMRLKGTQRAYSGNYIFSQGPATYSCAGCGLPLFSGLDQYNAGNGYPSFKKSISSKNVYFAEDWALPFKRYEVICRGCDSHLGHVFNDGPPPKKLRFCINSIVLERS